MKKILFILLILSAKSVIAQNNVAIDLVNNSLPIDSLKDYASYWDEKNTSYYYSYEFEAKWDSLTMPCYILNLMMYQRAKRWLNLLKNML
jgi:hypothetical protein